MLVLACGAGLMGCRGDRSDQPPHQFFPDLDDAPKWNPQTHSEFFADGRTLRHPPEHAVAFGRQDFVPPADEAWAGAFVQQRADLLKEDSAYYTGKQDGKWIAKAPIAFTQADILRGQERFGIYCSVCHGLEGDGQGMVGKQWATPVPSYHEPKFFDAAVEQSTDGYLFFTARNGRPNITATGEDWVNTKMPGYAHALSYDDTWRIVAYIRVLQQSKRGSINDVPGDKRPDVLKQMQDADAKAAAAAAAAAAATPAAPVPAPAAPATTGGGK